VYLLAVAVMLVAGLLAYFAGHIVHVQGASLLLLRVLISLAGVAAAAAIAVFQYRSGKDKGEATTSAKDSTDFDLALRDAARKLGTSQQGGPKTLDRLPLLYVLGDANSAKTATVLQSGLNPELLAGQVYRSGDIIPTPSLNLWYTASGVVVEIGESVRNDANLLGKLVRRTRAKVYRAALGSGAAPRAAVVCVSMEQFQGANAAQNSTASARALGGKLREISRQLGTALPVYVIFTKLDRVAHFPEFVRNLSNEEAHQVLGATLPRSQATAGTHAEQATQEIGAALDELCFSLAEFRLDLLARETDQATTIDVYEFPRELRKLRNVLTDFLVELSRPSQLSANPYLRGFYFTGVRAQVVEQLVSTPAHTPKAPVPDAGATRMFSLQDLRTREQSAPAATPLSHRVPQWTFLPRLLPQIIFGDASALSASREVAPARIFRRVLFASVAAICAIYLGLLFFSYRKNAALEQRILSAAGALAAGSTPAGALPAVGDLQALDQLRRELEQLENYQQNGPPLPYRWGLYQGNRLAESARRIYFDRFRQILLSPTQANFLKQLSSLPDAPAATDDYGSAYNPLKAYLITTSNPERSTPEFLTPVFLQSLAGGRVLEGEQQQLARQQVNFYASELRRANPFSIAPDTAVVNHARAYLSKFGGVQRIYQGILSAAEKANPPIDFNRQYPHSAEVVVDGHIVPGAFSRSGFAFVQDAMQHPDRFFSGETWVLGDQAAPSLDRANITQQLNDLYKSDFLKQWRAFLAAASVTGYRTLPDAAAKLNMLAGPTSPLLELFYTVSHNTNVPAPQIASVFQPTQVLVNPDSTDRYIGPGNSNYINALQTLQGAIAQVAQTPGSPDPSAALPIQTAAGNAHTVVGQTSGSFSIDQQAHVEATVIALLNAPIRGAESLVRGIGPAAANAAGRIFCGTFDALVSKYPFAPNATVQASPTEVAAVFAPGTGALWQFYNVNLKTLVLQQGTQYLPAPGAPAVVTPAFLHFFTHAAAISTELFAQGGTVPNLSFTLHQVPTKGVQNATLSVDTQRITGLGATQPFIWNAQTAQQAQLSASYADTKDFPLLQFQGTWALFQLLNKAHPQRSSGITQLEFPLEISGTPIAVEGTPLVIRFAISGPSTEVLTPGGLGGLRCVSQVAR
jgi:type VI secretion system protein ImpL